MKVIVGISLLIFVISRVDLSDVWANIRRGDSLLCFYAFVVFGLSRVTEGLRLAKWADMLGADMGISHWIYASPTTWTNIRRSRDVLS